MEKWEWELFKIVKAFRLSGINCFLGVVFFKFGMKLREHSKISINIRFFVSFFSFNHWNYQFSKWKQGVATIRAYNQESRFMEILLKRMEMNNIAVIMQNTSNRWLGIALVCKINNSNIYVSRWIENIQKCQILFFALVPYPFSVGLFGQCDCIHIHCYGIVYSKNLSRSNVTIVDSVGHKLHTTNSDLSELGG